MTDQDGIIRKVQALLKTARHPSTGAEEASAAQSLADKLTAKYRLTEEDLEEYEDTAGFFGIKLDKDYHRRSAKYYRLKKEAEDSLYRLVAFLQEEGNAPWRMSRTYETLDKQLQAAKAQFKKCDWCHAMGFGDKDMASGLVERHDVGWKTKGGRVRPAFFHKVCKRRWEKMCAEQMAKAAQA